MHWLPTSRCHTSVIAQEPGSEGPDQPRLTTNPHRCLRKMVVRAEPGSLELRAWSHPWCQTTGTLRVLGFITGGWEILRPPFQPKFSPFSDYLLWRQGNVGHPTVTAGDRKALIAPLQAWATHPVYWAGLCYNQGPTNLFFPCSHRKWEGIPRNRLG